jgi:RHS repeat-associated protein
MIKAKKKWEPRSLAGWGPLKMAAGSDFKASAERLAVACCTLFILSTGYPSPPPASGDSPPTALVNVNRTVPQAAPPKTTLEFSASPTTQELFRARIFQEPLVPIGGEPGVDENAALAAALLGYANRSGPDDFASLTGFLEQHPKSPWRAALLTDLGLEYYNTAHYSLALEAWEKARPLAKQAHDARGKAIADRAVGELAYMYARLGRMTELEALLKSVENRGFVGAATERITGAREGLWNMQNKPEISFKCGPYALQRILLSDQRLSTSSPTNAMMEIFNFPSTQKGCSLPQVAELSKKVGLNYQMAFRAPRSAAVPAASSGGVPSRDAGTPHPRTGTVRELAGEDARATPDFIVPSVVHWKVGHYAAMVRQEGDRFLLEDPTFGNTVWATREALEAETSGYFLIPPGELPRGWRSVDALEGGAVWGKGATTSNDGDVITPNDMQTGTCEGDGTGMAVSSVHLMTVNMSVKDTPVGYTPPVGPPVRFTVRYNSRDPNQPANFSYANFGPKWTCDWISYITDNPQSLSANVKYYAMGGGARTFEGFDTNTQAFGLQQMDQTRLTRTAISPIRYELLQPNGAKLVFSQSGGTVGTSRKIFLTRIEDPAGNALTLNYDGILRLETITDAIGQVTTLTYGLTNDIYKVTKVTDPFGRFATLNYVSVTIGWNYEQTDSDCPPHIGKTPINDTWLSSVTDVLGLVSQFDYLGTNQAFFCVSCPTNPAVTRCVTNQYAVDFVSSLTTPYGTTSFSGGGGVLPASTRLAEVIYPDGSRERVEFNQTPNTGVADSILLTQTPGGMLVHQVALSVRNTFYWSRTAAASSYGDYSKARIYHWCHKGDLYTTAGILENIKEPLENRVFFNYTGQEAFPQIEGSSSTPTKIGRVLDDGQTQLYTMAYDSFGKLTNSIDPIGRTFSLIYATNGIDLLEVRQTRAANNEVLARMSYNAQHRPLAVVDAAGQTNTFSYNARGQVLTNTNAKGETTTYTYTADGFLSIVDGPLPGTNDTVKAHYDIFGRIQTMTGLSGYLLTFDYDVMDRVTKITHPDGTFEQFTYDRLDLVTLRDRAGRQTFFEYDAMHQLKKRTDPLGRETRFDWCRCGQLKSLTDPMGRTTTWLTDVQGRPIAKQYADGSQVQYQYENTIGRLRFVIDEKQQVAQLVWNRDNTFKSVAYGNALIPTPGVSYQYDPDYERIVSMTDGTGTTRYSYNPVTGIPTLGAGGLASVDGPLPNDTITYSYDELNRPVHRAINGVGVRMNFDETGRLAGITNALGPFAHGYDGSTARLVSKSLPNGQTEERSYGNNVQDRTLQRITHALGAIPISEFLYGHDVTRGRITTWSQQMDATTPSLHTFGYDAVNQLLSATVTNAGNLINIFAYAYDPAGNRLTEQVGASNYVVTYNGLNEIRTTTAPGITRTNEWDALDRLVAVNIGNQRTEFAYDGLSRRVAIRQLLNGAEVSHRRFVWCGSEICEERNAVGAVTKRFFPQGVKVESGPVTGVFFYTRDHLGSIRELVDSSGIVRARYAYDPYGRRRKLTGDLDADFGFAGMFFSTEANLSLTHFRAYDPELGRWLSRDPLGNAELKEGPNLYAYIGNEPINRVDPLGLCLGTSLCACFRSPTAAAICINAGIITLQQAADRGLTAIQNGVTRCGQVISTVPQRLAYLRATLPEIEDEIAVFQNFAAKPGNQSSITGWMTGMIRWDREFFELAEILALEYGIEFDEAWALLVETLGENPETWVVK